MTTIGRRLVAAFWGGTFAAAYALGPPAVAADTLATTEFQVTMALDHETTPTLGNDGVSDLVVFTMVPLDPDGFPGPGDIWRQRLAAGAPMGAPRQLTADPTDDRLNDVSGDYVVYTAFDNIDPTLGTIMALRMSTGERYELGPAGVVSEPRIHGNNVVWVQGIHGATQVMWYDLAWLGTPQMPRIVAGPVPPADQVAIGENFITWSQRSAGESDIWAFSFASGMRIAITLTAGIDETEPATSGDWIVWQAREQGATETTIEAKKPTTLETRVIADNGAGNYRPSIDGDLIAWDSRVTGNFDVFLYRLSTGESFQVTTDPADQRLNDVFGSRVAYVDLRNGTQDIYVSDLTFVPPCGDGIVTPGEGCDDGGTTPGDGCDAACQVECPCTCEGTPSVCTCPVLTGVAPTKLIVVDNLSTASRAKVVFVAKDGAVTKGGGTDATAIGVEFTAAYANGSAAGAFVVPVGDAGWLANKSTVAKFVNKTAPSGTTQTRVSIIKPGKLVKLVGKGLGDTPFDILAAGDPAGDVHTAYCVTNGGEETCHCSTFTACTYKLIAADTGAKLVCRTGTGDAACAAICP